VSRIAVLPSIVADQIAAGEVVERPASAAKELLENAIDAGATSVDVEIEDGGRALVRVSDDGCGMDRADALLALERHATSKIRVASDLVGVSSFGFRGEALPAICSVSRLELTTATADGAGVLVRAAGGAVESVETAARRRGTTVSVADVFYNTPARRKFLRSARSEWRSVLETITSVALARWDVRLRVTVDGREAVSLPPARTLRERVAALWGNAWAARFVDVDAVVGPVRVTGLVERPGDAGTSSRRVSVLVNGRAVRDFGLVRSVEAAYRSAIAPGVRPSLVLAIVLPGEAVDVNVHPAKVEVRFRDRFGLERAVEQAVRRALGTADSVASLGAGVMTWTPRSASMGPPSSVLSQLPSESVSPLFAPPDAHSTPDARGPGSEAVNRDAPWQLVQLRRAYLLYEHEDGVVLIDQHSAHERILYERFLRELEQGNAPSQRLLLPDTLHLSPDEAEALDRHGEALARLGYELEPFGGHSVIVHAVPAPHPRFDAIRCLRETLQGLSGDRGASVHARHERLVATIACKAAVKAGDALSPEEMRALYRALASTVLPAHDVHGRAAMVRLTWDELDRRFGRR
jgi:DNA mismatch repair protein MutL